MYGATLFIGVNNSTTVQPVVAIERTIFYRERAAGMYAAVPYAIAQVLTHSLTLLFSMRYCPHVCSEKRCLKNHVGHRWERLITTQENLGLVK
jgi:hypothetical protein